MQVPELLYDRGEVKNLSIQRGTLTDEERYKINEHIVLTIKMLEAMPFPRHLKAVPEIAGGHHERIDSKGYPRAIPAAAMSIPARMMAIADVFEALTATDRPYKQGKSADESLDIMRHMAREGTLTPNCSSCSPSRIFRPAMRHDSWPGGRLVQPSETGLSDCAPANWQLRRSPRDVLSVSVGSRLLRKRPGVVLPKPAVAGCYATKPRSTGLLYLPERALSQSGDVCKELNEPSLAYWILLWPFPTGKRPFFIGSSVVWCGRPTDDMSAWR
jgi:hypothetical protein